MIVFSVILTLVCFLRTCHMWLSRNHMFIRKIWGKFTSVSLGRFQNFKKVNSVNLSQISLLNMWFLVQICKWAEKNWGEGIQKTEIILGYGENRFLLEWSLTWIFSKKLHIWEWRGEFSFKLNKAKISIMGEMIHKFKTFFFSTKISSYKKWN